MSTFCVATLSTRSGFETKSPLDALSMHFTYWFASRRSQGKVNDKTPSFYYLVAKHGTIKEQLIEHAKEELQTYIKELFPESRVFVTTSDKPGTNSQYTLVIGATVLSDGIEYNLANTVVVTGEHFRILDIARNINGNG